MEIKYKFIQNQSQVYSYIYNLKDVIKIDIDIKDGDVENFVIQSKVGLNDDFQLIKNVEIILKEVNNKVIEISGSKSLLVYIQEYNDKYLFIKH